MAAVSQPIAADIIFVVEGTALNGAYLPELKQHYITPILEQLAGHIDDRDFGSDSNYCLFGLVVFHASDILPGYLSDVYGPITTSYKLLAQLDRIQFAGGHGEAQAHVAEGLATALHCIEDLSKFRNKAFDSPKPSKHIILICNCRPYGLPAIESVGIDGNFKGQTAEQLAALMIERNIHLTILAPRKIPALITMFDRAGGDLTNQKSYSRDPRHLVLLNGFHLQVQERPATPQQPKPQPTQAPQEVPPPPISTAAATSAPIQVPQSVSSSIPTSTAFSSAMAIPQSVGPQIRPQVSVPQPSQSPQIPLTTQNAQTSLVQSLQPGMPIPPHSQVQQQQQHMIQMQQAGNAQFRNPRPIRPMMGQAMQGQLSQQQQQQTNQQMKMNPQVQNQQIPNQQLQHQIQNQQMQQIQGQQMAGQIGGQQQQLLAQQQMNQQLTQQRINLQQQQQQQMMNQQMQMNPQQQMLQQQQRWPSQIAQPQGMQQTRMTAQLPPQQPQVQVNPTPTQPQIQRPSQEILARLNQPPIVVQSQSPPTPMAMQQQQQQPNIQKERRNIWSGLLEWHEKLKGPPEGQKVPRQVPCQVSANVVNNEPEVKGDGWPQKLIMQLIPKAIVGNLGGSYFMDVKTVLFLLQQCEALASLTRVMESGFAGCVHFTGNSSSCAIKVLILLYSKERCAYLGFIPNDQAGFVDRIRKVIQQQKNQQASLRQGGAAFPPQGGLPARMMGMPQQNQQLLAQQLQGGQPLQSGQQLQADQMQPAPPVGIISQQQQQSQQSQLQQMQAILPQSQPTSQQGEDPREVERQRNVQQIRQLQLQLEAAKQRELEFQQMQSGQIQAQSGMAGQTQVSMGQQQQGQGQMVGQQQLGIAGLQQQQQGQQQRQQFFSQQQRQIRPSTVQQQNPGLKSLLQQQTPNIGPPGNFRGGLNPMARMQSMQSQQGMMQQDGNQQLASQQQQHYEDVRILDLLK